MADAQVLDNVNVVENTANSTTWVDGASIPDASFTANKEYLILAVVCIKGTSVQLAGTRLVHGPTPTEFTDATGATEHTSSDVGVTQMWLFRYTQPATTELVKVQFNNSDGTNVMTHQFSRIIAIKLSDDFTENTDFFWQELTTDAADAATFTSRAAVTFTPNGSNSWLIIGQACSDPSASAVAHSLRINDSIGPANYGGDNRNSKDIDDIFNTGYWVGVTPSAVSHTFTVQTQSATSTNVKSSRIIALNLAKFAQSAIDYTAAAVTPATAPSWTTVASVSPTPDVTGNWVVLANAMTAPLVTDNVFSRLQVNPGGGGLVSDPAYGDNRPDNAVDSNTLFAMFHIMFVRSLTSGAARPCNHDFNKAGGTPTVKERAMIAFSVALASTAGPQTVIVDTLTLSGAPPNLTVVSVVSVPVDSLTLSGSIPNMTVVPGAVSPVMNALTLSGSAVNLAVIPGAVSLTLNVLTLAGSTPNMTVVAVTSVAVDVLTLAGSVPNMTVIPGTATVITNALTLAGSTVNMTVVLGTANVVVDSLTLAGSTPNMSVMAGAVSVVMNVLTLTGSPVNMSVTSMVSIQANALTLTSSAPNLSVVPGAVSITLDVTTLAGSAVDMSVQTGSVVQTDTLILASSAVNFTVVPGAATIAADALILAGAPQNLTVAPGGVSVAADVLSLNASVQDITVVPVTVIPTDTLTLTGSILSFVVVPGATVVTLNTLTFVSTAQDLAVNARPLIIPGDVSLSVTQLYLASLSTTVVCDVAISDSYVDALTLASSPPNMVATITDQQIWLVAIEHAPAPI